MGHGLLSVSREGLRAYWNASRITVAAMPQKEDNCLYAKQTRHGA